MSSRRNSWAAFAATLGVAVAATAGWGIWQTATTAQQTTPEQSFSAEEQVITTAKRSGEAVLSYTYTDVAHIDAATALTTGEFRTHYRQFADATVIPAMLQKKITTTAVVVGAGIQSLSADNAKVLLFVDQSTTSEAEPVAKAATSSVLVGLQKVGDAWLISQLQPI